MNNFYTTQGLDILILGNGHVFTAKPALQGPPDIPWKLVSATLLLYDPNGNLISLPGTLTADGYGASASWIVAGAQGQWSRAWQGTDVNGKTQIGRAKGFMVLASPA